jgi:hypothetical protein
MNSTVGRGLDGRSLGPSRIKNFQLSTVSRSSLGSIQTPNPLLLWTLYPRIKQPGREGVKLTNNQLLSIPRKRGSIHPLTFTASKSSAKLNTGTTLLSPYPFYLGIIFTGFSCMITYLRNLTAFQFS